MHPFPPPQQLPSFWQPATAAVLLHSPIAIVVLGLLGRVLLRKERKGRFYDALAWCIAGVFLTGIFLVNRHLVNGFAVAYLLIVCGAVLAGIGASWMRVEDGREVAESIGLVGACIILPFLLVSLDTGNVSSARTPARRTICKDNLHNLGLAFYNYHDAFGSLPAHVDGTPLASWRVDMLPYLDSAGVQAAYDFASEWNSPVNLPVARQRLPLYTCPSTPASQQQRSGLWFTSYALATGDHTYWPGGGPLTFDDTVDDTANTLLIIEACGQQIVWTEPRDIDLATTPVGMNLPGAAEGQSAGVFSSYHTGGSMATFADGSVRFLSVETDPQVLQGMLTIDGGEALPDEF